MVNFCAVLGFSNRSKKEKDKGYYRIPAIYPRCLFSLIAFEIRCIGRLLLVLGSRLKNEENMHVSLCFFSMIIFTDGF